MEEKPVVKSMNARIRVVLLAFALPVVLLGAPSGPVAAGPLHEAVESGNFVQARALMTPGLNINELDSSGVAAIHLAVLDSNPELLEFLINNGADVNITIKSSRRQNRFYTHLHEFAPLHLAANFHHTALDSNSLELARLLITRGADVDQKTDDGQSPLHLAVRSGNDRLVKLLIANGADVNARDFEEYTPLHSAAWKGHVGVVETLVSNGANVSASAYDGITPYRCAVRKNHTGVISFFEKLGIVQ